MSPVLAPDEAEDEAEDEVEAEKIDTEEEEDRSSTR